MNDETTTVLLIMNGEAAADDELRETVAHIRDRGFEIEVRVTWESGDAHRYAAEFGGGSSGVDAIVACGGDGTLNEVINAVMKLDERPMIGGLPYGTGNDFLRGLGIEPRHAVEQFETWLDIPPTAIDVGCANGTYFLNMASAGIAAEVTAEASREFKEVAGSFAYFVRAIPAAFDIPAHRAKISGGEELDWTGDLAFCFVGNGQQSGGGWRICPAARLNDGLLDVVIVPSMPLREMARHGREMVKAEAPGDYGPLVYRQIEAFSVQFEETVPMNLDGEPVDGERFEFRAMPEAIRFLVPPA